jgi:hypothetical protein
MTVSITRDDRNVTYWGTEGCDICEFIGVENQYRVVKIPNKRVAVLVERKRKDGSLVWADVSSYHHSRRYSEARSFVEERVWA